MPEPSQRSFLGTMASPMTYGRVGPWRTTVIEANVKILEPAFYQAFFGRLDASVFLLKEKL